MPIPRSRRATRDLAVDAQLADAVEAIAKENSLPINRAASSLLRFALDTNPTYDRIALKWIAAR